LEVRSSESNQRQISVFEIKTSVQRHSISEKKAAKKLSGRERRFQRDVNHNIDNWIVLKPHDVIALEDLTNISKGKKIKKLGKWSFSELRSIVEYKAAAIGKKVVAVDPRYTSRICSRCGFQKKENAMVEPSNARAVASRSMQI
jgi:putative transposase